MISAQDAKVCDGALSAAALPNSAPAAWLVDQAEQLLHEVSARLAQAPGPEDLGDLARIIETTERVSAASTAVQMRAETQLWDVRVHQQREAGTPPAQVGRGVPDEIAHLRRISPARAGNQVALHRVVVQSLPRTLSLLEHGEISPWAAEEVAKATLVLTDADRARVDEDIAAQLPEVSPRRAGVLARARAAELDQEAALRRHQREVASRHVSIRPMSDALVQISAVLPSAEGVAVYAALDAAASAARSQGVEGTRGQHMADALFRRVTGVERVEQIDVEIQLLMTDSALLGGGADTAWIDGQPVPGAVARHLALAADGDGDSGGSRGGERGALGAGGSDDSAVPLAVAHGRRFIRRLYTDPLSMQLREADARRRCFTGADRRFLEIAHQRCLMPFCEAKIRHIDHVQGYASGGLTTRANGAGLCEHCNYLLEQPGWSSRWVEVPGDDHGPPRRVLEVTTPTGRTARSEPPPLRWPSARVSTPLLGVPPPEPAALELAAAAGSAITPGPDALSPGVPTEQSPSELGSAPDGCSVPEDPLSEADLVLMIEAMARELSGVP